MTTNMEEQLISLKTAKLAKEKGFVQHKGVFKMYKDEDGHLFQNVGPAYDILNHCSHAPSQSLLQKWLREEHGIDVLPYNKFKRPNSAWAVNVNEGYNTRLDFLPSTNRVGDEITGTYEEALEKGLQEALKLI